jgi:hypothetical protein
MCSGYGSAEKYICAGVPVDRKNQAFSAFQAELLFSLMCVQNDQVRRSTYLVDSPSFSVLATFDTPILFLNSMSRNCRV